MINISTVNYYQKGDNILNTSIDGEETLLDSDLVILNPEGFNRLWEDIVNESSDGKRRVYSPHSDRIRNIFESRKNEIETLLINGKVIVCFVSELAGFYGEIDDKSRYNIVTNYDCLPLNRSYLLESLKAGKGAPKSIRQKNSSLFSPYFSAFKNELFYSAYLDISTEEKSINFLVNRSSKPVGFLFYVHDGVIAFLPQVQFKSDNKKLISTLVRCTKEFIEKRVVTPPPNWVEDFKLDAEEAFDSKILEVSEKIEELEIEKSRIEGLKYNITKYKALLYEQGSELEDVVIEAFCLMGFNAERREVDDMEHDIVFESQEGRGLAELEGKDNDSIHITKLDQLNRAVDEDFELTGSYPQGLLIGNHFRFKKPQDRDDPFTEKVHIVAKKKSFGLLTTFEIFKAVKTILHEPTNETLKKVYREKILGTTGEEIKLADL